jgi:hypothetical protein
MNFALSQTPICCIAQNRQVIGFAHFVANLPQQLINAQVSMSAQIKVARPVGLTVVHAIA